MRREEKNDKRRRSVRERLSERVKSERVEVFK